MILGYSQALDSLRDSLDLCVRGSGQVVLVNGGLASGKTELLQEFSEISIGAGALQLSATGSRGESDMQLGVLWQLFHSAPLPSEMTEQLSRYFGREMMDSAIADVDREAERYSDARVMHGLFTMLLGLSQERPVVICIDDMHFADEASLQVILYLRRRIRSARIMLVLTEWVRPDLLHSVFRTEVTRYPYHRISLGTLSLCHIAELIGERLDDPARSAELACPYYALTGGNMLLVSGLLEDNFPGGQPAREAGEPMPGPAYRQAVLDCLQRWDLHLFDVARGLAILGSDATAELLSRLLSMKPDALARQLDILGKAGLLADGRLRHPEIVATIRATFSAEDTARLHASVAELLYERGAEAIEIARHLVKAGTARMPWAQQILRRAAQQALVEGEADFATDALELALLESQDEKEHLELQSLLTHVAWWVNPSAAARYLESLNTALFEGRLSQQDALAVVRQLMWQGSVGTAAEHMEAMTGGFGASDTRALTELRLSYEWIYGSPRGHDTDSVRGRRGKTAHTRSAIGSEAHTATSLYSLWDHGSRDDLVSSAEHILQGRLIDTIPEAGATAILLLDHAGHPKRAAHWRDVLGAEADRQGAITWQAMLGGVAADMALRRGGLVAAEAQARGALDLLPSQSWGALIGFPLATQILAATAMGDHEQAAELLDQVVPESMFDTVFGLRYLHASGHYHLSVGRPFAALSDFERCASLIRKWGLDIPAFMPWRSDLAQTHLALGQRKRARALLVEQLDRLGSGGDLRCRGISLRLLALVSPLEGRSPLLSDAVGLLERSEDHLEVARALADLSQVHQELGELGEARLLARRAEQEAKACNAEVLSTLQLKRTPSRPTVKQQDEQPTAAEGATALSEAERKVATLAAFGHSNREIGRKLYITVSTVEQHLTRVYRKLNVQRRADLPSGLSPEFGADGESQRPDGRSLRSA